MLNFLKSHKNNFLGIDFGTSAIKIVELSHFERRTHLVNYAWANFSKDGSEDFVFSSSEKELGKFLKKIVSKMDTKTEATYVSMPALYGLITNIEFPDMEKNELDQAIKLEAHKYVPSSLEDVYLSWDVISREKTGLAAEIQEKTDFSAKDRKVQVLLVAAPKKEVNRYEKVLELAGLDTKSLELDTFSVARSLTNGDMGTNLIIEMGAKTSNIIVTEKGNVIISRNLDIGGNEITRVIASSMNVAWNRAEKFKMQGKDFFNNKEAIAITPTLELIAKEVMRVISAYQGSEADKRIDNVILSGGLAKLKGVDKFFSEHLKMKCEIGNPWKKIEVDKRVVPFVEQMGTSFSVPLGLALKGVDDYLRDLG